MGALAFTFPILLSSWDHQRSPQKASSQLQALVGPVGSEPSQVWGFGAAPSLPAGTIHLFFVVLTVAQLKLENTEQTFLASCNFVLALYCMKNSFYFILKPCFLLQNNQYTQNLSAWGTVQEWALVELRAVEDEKDLTITLRKVIKFCLGFFLQCFIKFAFVIIILKMHTVSWA